MTDSKRPGIVISRIYALFEHKFHSLNVKITQIFVSKNKFWYLCVLYLVQKVVSLPLFHGEKYEKITKTKYLNGSFREN